MTQIVPLERIQRMGSPDRFGPQIYLGGEAAGSSASMPDLPSLLHENHRSLTRNLNQFEQKYDSKFADVFDAIREIMKPEPHKRKAIGISAKGKERFIMLNQVWNQSSLNKLG
jgi:hypothetical protein